MNKTDIHNYFQTIVSRKIADIKFELDKNITKIERESAASGRLRSGSFYKMIVDAHLSTIDRAMKSIFDEAKTITLEFDIEFDDDFKAVMTTLLNDYFKVMSNNDLLEMYLSRFGQADLNLLTNCGWDHNLPLIQCWYLNNIEPFTFKLRNEVRKMKESPKGNVTNIINGNDITVTTAINSNVSVNVKSVQKGTDAVAALDVIIKYLRDNDVPGIGIEDKEDIVASIEEVKNELQNEKPNKFKMKSLMTPVVSLLDHADKIAPAIEAIKSIF